MTRLLPENAIKCIQHTQGGYLASVESTRQGHSEVYKVLLFIKPTDTASKFRSDAITMIEMLILEMERNSM